MKGDYFSIERDNQIIANDGFWCHSCLVGKEAIEQSPDSHYCQGCHDFLLKEAKMLVAHVSKANWIPQKPKTKDKEVSPVSQHGGVILSTLNDEKSEVDKIQPTPTPKSGKRGRKPKSLPVGQIKKLAAQGFGSRAIATRLKQNGVIVSYKTIQRMLSL